jgi:tRNA(Ile2) C34 agmatinyltransferase TiaS
MLWLACTAVVIAAGFVTLRPLFRETEGNLDIDLLAETELDRLLDRKNVIYRNLRDLKFEYRMGRLSDVDFQQLDTGYKNEAAAVLQRLDQLNSSENFDEQIEREVTARKTRLYGAQSKRERVSPRCPSCGAEIISGKKFCADCGHRL